MEISGFNFDSAETATKRCIAFARDGNKVVKPYKKLYSFETLTGNSEHDKLFLEVVQWSSCVMYKVWEQLTDFCICIGSAPEYATVEDLTKGLQEYKFLGVDGYLNFLKEKEKFGDFINLLDIEVCRLLKQEELADHYTEYRENFLRERNEREAKEQAEREQKEQEENARKAAEREKQLQDAEDLLRKHQTLYNEKMVDGSSLILALMKCHGVNVPLRTQGWINKALHSITFNQGTVGYLYYTSSSDSKVFKQYLLILQEKIGGGENC